MTSLLTDYSPLSAQLVAWACRFLIQSTLLMALALTGCAFLHHRSAALRSSILRVTLLAAIICPFLPSLGGPAAIDIPIPSASPALADQPGSTSLPSLPAAHHTPPAHRRLSMPISTTPATSPVQAEPEKARLPILYAALSLCWIAGTAFLSLRLARSVIQARHLRRSARPAPRRIIAACHALAEKMTVRPPAVTISPAVGSPLLLGLLRPTIVLPEPCDPTANTQVFAHELAHIRRRDGLWTALASLATAVCFFQPLLWKLTRSAEQTNEEACDDFVLSYAGHRRTYARRLVEMAETLGYGVPATVGIGVVQLRSSLGRRIQRLLSSRAAHAIQTGRSEMLAVALLAFLAVAFVAVLRVHPTASAAETARTEAADANLLPLVRALAGSDWRRREQAAIEIAQANGDKAIAIPALISALSDDEWRLRKAAAVALTTTGPTATQAVPALIEALYDEEWQVRRPAADALAGLGPAARPAVPALTHAVADDQWHVRRAAAVALATIGPAAHPATPHLMDALADEEWHVRESAAFAIGAIGPDAAVAIPTLIQRLEDPDMQVRRAAASALERIAVGDRAAIPKVIGALRDSEWQRRQAAAQSLERLL